MRRGQERHHIDQSPSHADLFPGEPQPMVGIEMPGLGPGKREVDLYVRTYMTLLQSSGAISVSSLEPAHLTAASSLHAGATESAPDMSAFIYSTQRLPSCIIDVRDIVLGQSATAFARSGQPPMSNWQIASAPGRRRRWLYDGDATLAAYIASVSDLDDLVPTIVAYQIEWNKMHRLIAGDDRLAQLIRDGAKRGNPSSTQITEIGKRLRFNHGDWSRLRGIWGDQTWSTLDKIAQTRKRYTLRLLSGSYVGYARTTRQWWSPAARLIEELDLADRPVYFVSSNTHSIVNVLSGAVRRRKDDLSDHIREHAVPELVEELDRLEAGESRSSWDNLLYFAGRSFFAGEHANESRLQRAEEERAVGIHHIDPAGAVDVGIQIIELAKLDPAHFDPRLRVTPEPDSATLDPRESDAIIVNVNYPLGLAAYHIMSQVGMSLDRLRGIYILGKAATLNGRIGDVMIADVVYDEHSGNTYWFDNCFGYADLAPFLVYGAALDNQRAVTVKGTYLQNQGYLDFYYRENYTVVEMEAGPYLDAIYEDVFLRRYPASEAINLRLNQPGMMDLGIIHYASDTPYTRAQTLGARGMSYHGMDSTYASTIAILRRVFQNAIAAAEPGAGDAVAV